MKSLMTSVAMSTLLTLTSTIAFANAGSETVLSCKDTTGYTVEIVRLTGVTGGVPGSYLALVTQDAVANGQPEPVQKQKLASGDISFNGKGVSVYVPGRQSMDLPVSQVRAAFTVGTSARYTTNVICDKGPAYSK